MVHKSASPFPQDFFSSAYLVMDMGLGDVKHREFSNLHILKMQNVLTTLEILFSIMQQKGMLELIFPFHLIHVLMKECSRLFMHL
jgi:hypothetical protein